MMKKVDVEPLLSDPNWHWQADLQLALSKSHRGTRLIRNRHNGPLYVQKPFYPEGKDCAHIYLLHPPGGLVSGDALTVDIVVEEQAHSLITTPGAARMYKARQASPVQKQSNVLRIGDKAILEWFPMEAIVYNGAAAELSTTIQLGSNSAFMGWEMTCFGLPASEALFEEGYFKQRYRIEQNGKPVFIDNLFFSASNNALFAGSAGMQSKPVSGFFISGPFNNKSEEKEELLESLYKSINKNTMSQEVGLTWLGDFCVVRYLGKSAYNCRQVFTLLWEQLRFELIKREACKPRIWFT